MTKRIPNLQVALDHSDLQGAIKAAVSVGQEVDIIEAGTVCLLQVGSELAEVLRSLFPDKIIVADTKCADAGGTVAKNNAVRGADWMTCICCATIPTMEAALKAIKTERGERGEIQIELYGDWTFEQAQLWLDAGISQAIYHQSRDALLAGETWGEKDLNKVKKLIDMGFRVSVTGVRKLQPNLRVQPMVIDPFAINELDYYLVSHFHSDHIDPYTAAAILNNPKLEHVKFIGPYHCGRIWEGWGVPKERIIVVKPGDTIELKDMKIHAVESFDRTCLVTLPVNGADETGGELAGLAVTDEEMAQKAVNYIFETPGGTIYHGADSHFSNYFAKHGKDFKIDVALNNYGENPVGIQDKMTSIDLLRMAENLRTKVIIPVHYDIWSNFMASTNEILELWKMRKDRLQYDFHPFIWEVGGKYTYPQDQHLVEYHHPRGFDDCFEQDSNIQFKALL